MEAHAFADEVPRFRLAARPPRILLAEDDPDMRGLVAWALRKDGYEVIEASDGVGLLVECAMRAGDDALDMIISDVRMPDLTALEVLSALRCRDFPTPIVLITAYGDPRTRAEARALGAITVLDKPLDLTKLRATVRDNISA